MAQARWQQLLQSLCIHWVMDEERILPGLVARMNLVPAIKYSTAHT